MVTPQFELMEIKMAENKENKPDTISFVDDNQEVVANEVNAAIDEIFEAMRSDKNEREVLGVENQDLDNDDKVAENLNDISAIYEDEEFKKRLNLIMIRDTNHVLVDNGGNLLGENENKTPEQVDEENKFRKTVLNEALEAAKHEVLMFYGRDEKFAAYNEEQKRKILEDGVTDVFNFKMAKAVAASAVKEATAEEAAPNTKENKDYQKQALADMRAALESFYSKKPYVEDKNGNRKPLTVSPRQILNTTVHTSNAMDEYENGLRQAKLNKAAQNFNQKKEDYNQKRRGFWGKAFDLAKNVWTGIKQNKARIITDAAVVMGAGLAATAAPIAAAAAMGAYFAGSSFAWLVNDERRNQKAKSDDKANWTGFKGMKNAWKSIMSDEKKKSKFIRQGSITATAGVVGAGLFGAAASTMGLAYGRIASGAARSVGSVTNQGANWAVTAKENKVALDSARTGFYVSAAAAILGNAVGTYFGLSHAADANVLQNADGVDVVSGAEVHTSGAEGSGIEGTGVESTGAETAGVESVATAEPVEVPTEWNADMGISENHWNEMIKKITGIYREHADIFGQENVSSEDAMQNMYQNIENARDAGYFEGQTNEEVLYKYMKLIEQTERAVPLKGTEYLVTKLDADGNPMYWVNAEEMSALNKIIICNEVTDVPADKLDGVLALINEKGKYIGEGADIGVTNNTYAGGRFDCEEYQNAWNKGAFVHKHPHINHQPAPAPVQEQPAPEPVKAEETVVNNPKPQQPLTGTEETTQDVVKEQKGNNIKYMVEKSTGKNNTVDSESGLPPKIKEQGTIHIPGNSGREM